MRATAHGSNGHFPATLRVIQQSAFVVGQPLLGVSHPSKGTAS
jgi:hypothetical protein